MSRTKLEIYLEDYHSIARENGFPRHLMLKEDEFSKLKKSEKNKLIKEVSEYNKIGFISVDYKESDEINIVPIKEESLNKSTEQHEKYRGE